MKELFFAESIQNLIEVGSGGIFYSGWMFFLHNFKIFSQFQHCFFLKKGILLYCESLKSQTFIYYTMIEAIDLKFDLHCHTKEGSIDSKVSVAEFADRFMELGS